MGGWSGIVLAAMLVAVLPQLANWGLQRTDPDGAPPQLALPDRLGDWRAEGAQIAAWQPRLVNPSASVQKAYSLDGRTVGVHIGYFRGQGPHSKLVSSQNVLVESQDHDWNQVATGARTLRTADSTIELRTAQLLGAPEAGAERRSSLTVWRTYWVGDAYVAGDAAAKLRDALARLRGRGDDGAWVVLYADEGSVRASNAALAAFAEANLGPLQELLRRTRDAR